MEKNITKYFFRSRGRKSLQEEKLAKVENLLSPTGVTKGFETSLKLLNFC